MSRQPNIILITTDQQRGDCLSINGHPIVNTPNLDYIAASTANFQSAFAECPSCIPARRTLLTGQRPLSHGLRTFQYNVPLDGSHTLPGELRKHGYQTSLVGKFHMQPKRKRYGFDQMVLSDGAFGDDYTEWLREIGVDDVRYGYSPGVNGNGWVGRPSNLPESLSHTSWVTNEALRVWRRRDPSAPLFLWISYFAPHPPLTPPQLHYDRCIARELPPPVIGDWAEQSPGAAPGMHITGPFVERGEVRANASDLAQEIPGAVSGSLWTAEAMRRCRAGYYGLIEHIDDQIGRLMGMLTHENSMVLMTSDHGEMLGDHNRFRKTLPYQASARVPFLIRTPEWMECSPAQHITEPVGLQDVMPTLLDAAGVEVPKSVDGSSLLSLINGGESILPWRSYIHGEHGGFYREADGNQYLTDGQEKYIWFTQTGEEQLFDLQSDPHEERNLAPLPQSSERLSLWRERMVNELECTPEGFSDGKQLIPGRPELSVRNADGVWVSADRESAGR